MPFVSERIVIEEEIPLIMKLINGRIPNAYGGNFAISSPISEN